MRHSHYNKLLSEERRRHGARRGWPARIRQLTIVTSLLLGLYVVCAINIWRHPRPIEHVWIDNVLVEVVEENWVDHARSGLLYTGLGCGGLLCVLRVFFGSIRIDSPTAAAASAEDSMAPSSPPHATRPVRGGGGLSDISTIAVPAWGQRRSAGAAAAPAAAPPLSGMATAAAPPPVVVADRVSTFNARRPMRSDKDLNFFLAFEAAQQQQQRGAAGATAMDGVAGLRYRSGGAGGAALSSADDGLLYHADTDAAGPEAISVTYEGRAGPSQQASDRLRGVASSPSVGLTGASAAPTLPWGRLGIFQLDEALQRTREWVSDLCRRLIADVDECDRWFTEHQIEAFDCHHSLGEMLPAPAQQPASFVGAGTLGTAGAGWWGGNNASSTAVPAAGSLGTYKLNALMQERQNCRSAQRGMQTLDTALRYDQRLALETRLDVENDLRTFGRVSADLTAKREYVLDRLRTFAKQRFLVSYNGGGGDPETWRVGFPSDAELLIHVLCTSVTGLKAHVHRSSLAALHVSSELAIYIGDTGEPYFYVRFRQGSTNTLLATRQGPTSLFEAILAFAAVIHTYYGDVFGGLRGTVDLSEVGLLKVVTAGRRSAWGGGES